MKIIFAVLLLCICCVINAQEYNVMLIPDSLTKNANAVKRFEELHIIIKANDKAIIKHKYAITILNEEGAEYSEYYNFYNKLQDLSNISGSLFDASGKKQKKCKEKRYRRCFI